MFVVSMLADIRYQISVRLIMSLPASVVSIVVSTTSSSRAYYYTILRTNYRLLLHELHGANVMRLYSASLWYYR